MHRAITGVLLLGVLTTGGCEQTPRELSPDKVTSDDVRRDVGKAVETAAEFSLQAKEDFQHSLEARLKDLDAEIAKLREKGADLKDQAAATFEKKMAEPPDEARRGSRQAGRGRSVERGGLEKRPEGSGIGLGRSG